MKKLKIKLLLIISIFIIGNVRGQTIEWNENYATTVFFDDFFGSVLDKNKWDIVSAYKRDLGLLIDSSTTVKVSNGNLGLTMINCPNCETTDWQGNTYYGNYAGGEVVSKASFQYGIFECRAKYAQGSGSWPAFWMIGGDGTPCPPGGYGNEIDIAEYFCKGVSNKLEHNIHHYHPPADCNTSVHHMVNGANYAFNGNNLYHNFKCVWTPNKISYYVDGILKHEINNLNKKCPETDQYWFPEFDLQLILSQQITQPYNISSQEINPWCPQTSYFDWVSVKRFFPTPRIEVPEEICTYAQAVLSTENDATNITWILSPSELFSGDLTGTGTTASINASGNNGQGKITYRFKLGDETFTAEKSFVVGNMPLENAIDVNVYDNNHSIVSGSGILLDPYLICPNKTYFIEMLSNNIQLINYVTTPTNWSSYPTGIFEYALQTDKMSEGNYTVSIDYLGNCSNSFHSLYFERDNNCNLYLVITPNPATGETTITIETESEEKTFDETAKWDLEVYNASQLLKEKLTGLRGQSTKIQTSGWKEGVYLVRVMYKGEILTGKLVVKR